jgi:uncharacterized membrane protein
MSTYKPRAIRLAVAGMTASAYIALTLGLSPLSFGGVQIRLAEILNLMAYIDPLYGAGVVMGCLVSNLYSPFGLLDAAVGTACTALAVCAISKTRGLFLASLWPVAANIPVALMIAFMSGTPIWLNVLTVGAGEFASATCAGYLVFRSITSSGRLMSILRQPRNSKEI